MNPTPGKHLFVETGTLSDVVLNWYGASIDQFHPYAEAYHSSARRLFEKSTPEELRDVEACPIVFLYRHSLELYLKEILINGQKRLEYQGKPFKTVKEILEMQHNLSELWSDFENFYRQTGWSWEEGPGVYSKIVSELHDCDIRSFSFRYPVKKTLDPSVIENFSFDLRHFCSCMDEVLSALHERSGAFAAVFDLIRENE